MIIIIVIATIVAAECQCWCGAHEIRESERLTQTQTGWGIYTLIFTISKINDKM